MKITVQKMFELPLFKNMVLLAGYGGLSRNVTGVTQGEIPNYQYLTEGVVILSTGYFYKDDASKLLELVKVASHIGVAAIGIKLGAYIEALPQEVIALADQLNLPMFQYPVALSFEDVAFDIQTEILDEQASRLRFSDMILRRFTEDIVSVKSLQTVLENLSDILKLNIVYYDNLLGDHIYTGQKDQSKSNLCKMDSFTLDNLLKTHKSEIVELGAQVCGYMILIDKDKHYHLTDYEKIAFEHASTVIRIQTQKELSQRQIKRSYLKEFVYDIITNNITSYEELHLKGELYDCNISENGLTLVIDMDDFTKKFFDTQDAKRNGLFHEREKLFKHVVNYYEMHYKDLIHINFTDYLIILLPCDPSRKQDCITELINHSDDLRHMIKDKFAYSLTIGIGKCVHSPLELHKSYEQAKQSVSLGRKIYGNDSTVYYEQLGVYNLLETIYDRPEASRFCDENIGKLVAHDSKYKTEYLESLKVLVKNNWNLKASSEALFIHYNTMKNRFKRISEILEKSLDEGETQLNLAIALKIIELRS